MIDTKKLRRLTQDATPGPWKMLPVGDGMQKLAVADSEFLSILTVTDDDDARFIAAANPAAITELLDRLEAAEQTVQDHLRIDGEKARIAQRLEAAEKERDAYKAAYNEWVAKTEWVQRGINEGTISAKYLGLHRADVMTSLLGEAEKDRDALRAKIAEMERQKPVGKFAQHPSNGLWEQDGYGDNPEASPLYALPGAKGE